MERFTPIDNGLRFDASLEFLKKLLSFGLLSAHMGLDLILKMMKISNQDVFKTCKTFI